jgi:hypothetical protein
MSSSKQNTQLTTVTADAPYDTSRLIFSAPQAGSVPDSQPPINFNRINISTMNEDGTVGDLIFPTGRVFSFGVQENINKDTGKVNGWVMPLALWNRDGATDDERAWTDSFNAVVEACKDHLLDNRDALEKYDLEESDLKKFNPLYWKREKGKIVKGSGPTLYTKILHSRKSGAFVTQFFDQNDEEIPALDLLGKYCHVESDVKIESIFVGAANKIHLQVKLYAGNEIELSQGGMRRLRASRPKAQAKVTESSDMHGDAGSVADSDEEEAPRVVKQVHRKKKPETPLESDQDPESEEEEPKKKIVRRVVRKKKSSD